MGKIVSVSGYLIGEYVFMIVASYVLAGLVGLMYTAIAVMEDKRLFLSPLVVLTFTGVIIYVLYLFQVRIGVVMFINGLLMMLFVVGGMRMVKLFKEEQYFGDSL